MTRRVLVPLGLFAVLAFGHCRGPSSRVSGVEPRHAPPAGSAPGICRIISMYAWKGQFKLHLECPTAVRVGQVGHVVDCANERPLPGGQVRVSRVHQRFAVVDSKPWALGPCRKVRFFHPTP